MAWLRSGLKADYRPQGQLFDPAERKAEAAELGREAALRNRRFAAPDKGVRTVADIMKEIADPKLKDALDRMEVGVKSRSV